MNGILLAALAGAGIYLYTKTAKNSSSVTDSGGSESTAGEIVTAAEFDSSLVVPGMTFTEAKDVYANAPGINDVMFGIYFDSEGNPYGGEGNSYWLSKESGTWKVGTPAGLISDVSEKLNWMSLLETSESVTETETETETETLSDAEKTALAAASAKGYSHVYGFFFTKDGYKWHDFSEGPAYWKLTNGKWYVSKSAGNAEIVSETLPFMEWLADPALMYAHTELGTNLPTYESWA